MHFAAQLFFARMSCSEQNTFHGQAFDRAWSFRSSPFNTSRRKKNIGQIDGLAVSDEEVLGLQIPVGHPLEVQVVEALVERFDTEPYSEF